MKNNLYLTFAAVLLIALGCGKGEFHPNPTLNYTGGMAITSPTDMDVLVLIKDDAANSIDISWTAADFGFTAATTYTIQVDVAGNNFANAAKVGNSTTGLKLSATVGQLNNALYGILGLPGEVAADIEMRLVAKISSEVDEEFSPAISLTVTPYTDAIVYPSLQVPGSYQGWNEKDPTTSIYSVDSDDKYEGYIYFPDPDAKYKYVQGFSWDTNWGDDGADGTLEPGGSDIGLTDAGMYRLNVNLNTLTHSSTKTSWGLIGDATPTGWDSDTDMIYDATENKLTITIDLVAGKIKFRANDDWPINLGDYNADGSLEYGGDDIVIADPGNYTIDLILNQAVYTYVIKKN